jgi:hypothetical protein
VPGGYDMDRSSRVRGAYRMLRFLVMCGLMADMFAVMAPEADAAENTCRARNLTKDTPVSTSLAKVIKAASAGDKIAVRRVCVGHFSITKNLTLVGAATTGAPKSVLHGNGSGRVLLVRTAHVKLVNLRISGGKNIAAEDAGGIRVDGGGVLTLKNTVVSRNEGTYAGGIMAGGSTAGHVRLNGSSAVINNVGTGIFVNSFSSSATLNGTAHVSGNSGNGVITYYGNLTLNDATSVDSNNGGIINQSGTTTLNDTSSVHDNTGVGIGTQYGFVLMHDSASVTGNTYGGIAVYQNGGLSMSESSSVSGNSSPSSGGGIFVGATGAVHMYDDTTVTGNTADSDDSGGEPGGGIYVSCNGTLDGAVDGGNVDANQRGVVSPQEDNIAFAPCP